MQSPRRSVSRKLLAVALAVATVVTTPGCGARTKIAAWRRGRTQAQADRYYQAGDYDKARIEYLNVLRTDPQNAGAIRQLGLIWLEAGAPIRAYPFLRTAREQNPQDPVVRVKFAQLLILLGQTAEARKEAAALLQEASPPDEAALVLMSASVTPDEQADAARLLSRFDGHDTANSLLARAALAMRNRDAAGADGALRRAMEIDPKSYQLHLSLAQLASAKGELPKADEEFKRAVSLAPVGSTVARLRYAEFKAQSGARAEGVAILQEITRQTPDCLPAWTRLAQIALNDKRYDEALALLNNVFSRDQANFPARMLQTQVWIAKGDSKQALESFDRLNSMFPQSPLVKLEWGRLLLQTNNPSQAMTVLNQAVTAYPDYQDTVVLLAEANLRNGDAVAAAAAMENWLKLHPSVVPAQLVLAQAYRVLGRRDEAAAIFREQTRVSPASAPPYFSLGLLLREQNKPAEARQEFERAAVRAPDDVAITAQLVDLDVAEKKFAEAHRRVQEQLARTPATAVTGIASLHFLEGRICAAEARWPAAEEAFQKALATNADLTGVREALVLTFVAQNKLPAALAQLESTLAKRPEDARPWLTVALICEQTKEFPKARDAYEKYLAAFPESPEPLNNLAWIHAEHLDQPDKGLDLARRARGLRPNDPSLADTLGWILYKKADYAAAVPLLEESARALPDNPEVSFHLGMANYMMGQTDAARAALRRALASPADFPGRPAATARLAALEGTKADQAKLSPTDLEALLRERPDDPLGWTQLGDVLAARGEAAKAASAYERALKLNPKLLPPTLSLAQILAGPLNDRGKALELARKARELAPNDPAVAGLLGRLAYAAGNFSWAYSLLQESVRDEANGGDAKARHALAWAAYSVGKIDEAPEGMQAVEKLAPAGSPEADDARTFLAMHKLLAEGNSQALAAAQPEVDRQLGKDANYVPALMARGAWQASRGESKPAVATYELALRRFPDFAPAQKRLAALLADDPTTRARAYDLAVKARKALPDDPELAQILAGICYGKKDYAYAIRLLEGSHQQRPLDAKSLFYLGMSYAQTKQENLSREPLEGALKAGLDDDAAADAKRVLARLTSQ